MLELCFSSHEGGRNKGARRKLADKGQKAISQGFYIPVKLNSSLFNSQRAEVWAET